MATKQELQEKLRRLQDSVGAVPQEFVADIEKEITETQDEIAKMDSNTTAVSQTPNAGQGSSEFLKTMMSTLNTLMASGSGSGVDSPEVRAIIKKYLEDDKVKLEELDEAVINFIKANQKVVLEIPNYSLKIEINSETAQIPNFYEIIDDVLAGNNVYLIGEAGGGKTYTAEQIAKTLKREYVTLNCSQYTSPLEILGGQSIEGFKQGKLIDCWKEGKILILDEMPKLDPNTAGLFNDALAKSSKTREASDAKINSANAEEPPIERNNNFGLIATGNIYPNEPPAPQYRGNNQQDLSLLDRFSGSVYFTEFSKVTDESTTRFKFLYDFLVGNYYEFIDAKNKKRSLPPVRGLRTAIEEMGLKNLALVSYRTNVSFRVSFEYELVRAIAKSEGKEVPIIGKNLLKAFKSYMVAFMSNRDTYNNLITKTGYNDAYIENMVSDAIKKITSGKDGFMNSLNDSVRQKANPIFETYKDMFVINPTVK
jgi:AAA domain (dynein-related subfamily)